MSNHPNSRERRRFLKHAGGLAGAAVIAAPLRAATSRGVYVVEHLSNTLRYASHGDTPVPESQVLALGPTLTGYADKFVYAPSEDVRLYFPQQGEPCASHEDEGCDYHDVVTIPRNRLPGGIYRCRVFSHNDTQEAIFIVNDPSDRSARRICVLYPTTTWQAYTAIGGRSLYSRKRTERVSVRRPITAPEWFHDPRNFHIDAFLHRHRIPFSVIDSIALHRDPAALDDVELVVLVAHDEYWSYEMRQALERHLQRGGRLLNLADAMTYKIKLDDNNISINKRNTDKKNADVKTWTGRWLIIDPEERVVGLSFRFGGFPLKHDIQSYEDVQKRGLSDQISPEDYARSGGLAVMDAGHPVFSGTGLRSGDWFGVDSEVLRVYVDGLPLTQLGHINRTAAMHTPPQLTPLARGITFNGRPLYPAVMADFRFQGRGRVLAFGSLGWMRAAQAEGDETVARITLNAVELLLNEKSAS